MTTEEIAKRVKSLPIPPDLHYDGVLGRLAQFTELNWLAPSYGASFTVPAHELTIGGILGRRSQKHCQFIPASFSSGAALLASRPVSR